MDGFMLYIRRPALQSALQGAKNTHADEFIGLFRGQDDGKDVLLTELIIPPFSTYDADSSSYSPYFIPANSSEKASFHSHPDPDTSYPSDEDLHFFSRSGSVHFIASYPFRLSDVRAFDASGKRIRFYLVD